MLNLAPGGEWVLNKYYLLLLSMIASMIESKNFGFPETSNETWNNLSSEHRWEGNVENVGFCGNSFLKGTALLDGLLSAKKKQPQQHRIYNFQTTWFVFPMSWRKGKWRYFQMESWSYRKWLLLVFKSIQQSIMSRRQRKKRKRKI